MRKITLLLILMSISYLGVSALRHQIDFDETKQTVKRLVEEGRTWWYRSEQRSTGDHQEFGIGIGEEVEIDGKSWNKVVLVMYTDKTSYNEEPTSAKKDSTTISYIREVDGLVITKAAGTTYDDYTVIGALSDYLQGTLIGSTDPFKLYYYGTVDEDGFYGFDEMCGQSYKIEQIVPITNSAVEYSKYVTAPISSPNALIWLAPGETFDYVDGIGSPKGFLLMPYGGGTTDAFGWDSPKLTYVTEGDDNHVVFKAKGGIKIWNLGSVETVVVGREDGPSEWYNLQGVRVDADSAAPGVYIRRQGSTTFKVIIR